MRYLPSKSLSGRVSFSQDKIPALGVKCLLNRKMGALRRIVAATTPLHVRRTPAAYALTRAQKATAMLTRFSSGRSLVMRSMDASGALRTLDGWTGGRVLSFSRAETARPTVNQGVRRPRGVLEAMTSALG